MHITTSLISHSVSEIVMNNTWARQGFCESVCVREWVCWGLLDLFPAGFPSVSRNREAYQSIDQQDGSSSSANPFNQAQDSKAGVRTYWEQGLLGSREGGPGLWMQRGRAGCQLVKEVPRWAGSLQSLAEGLVSVLPLWRCVCLLWRKCCPSVTEVGFWFWFYPLYVKVMF